MRLGKTKIAINAVKQYKDEPKRILVLCPKVTVGEWVRQLKEYKEKIFRLGQYKNLSRGQLAEIIATSQKRVWLVLNHDAIRVCPEIAFMDWDCCILDESVVIANPKAQISEVCVDGFRKARHRFILTGVIAPENKLQVFNQFKFCDGQFLGYTNYWQFRERLFTLGNTGYDWLPKAGTLNQIKSYIEQECFTLSRREAGIGPGKEYILRTVEMPVSLRKIYKDAERKFIFQHENGEILETQWRLVVESWLMRLCSGYSPTEKNNEGKITKPTELLHRYKLDTLIEILNGELAGEQVIIWCHFLASLKEISNLLGDKAGVIYGGISQDSRSSVLKNCTKGKYRYLIAQQGCAKYGIDCSFADTSIYFERSLSCNTRIQSEDRIIHGNKKGAVLIVDLVTEKSVDEDSILLLRNKKFSSKLLTTKITEQIKRRI